MEKEHWKDEVLRSLEGARRAEPDHRLYARIRARVEGRHNTGLVRRPYLALAAAALALLLTANVLALARQRPAATPAYSGYALEVANFNLY